MVIYNEAVGASMARRGVHSLEVPVTDPYGWTGLDWTSPAYSLSMTLAEKNELITNWVSKWNGLLVGTSKPATLDAATQAFWRDCSWENKLNRHLGSGNRRDLYIFDHGHNDWAAANTIGAQDVTTVPGTYKDRGYFLGAMDFLIDKILSDNPKARIMIMGHYENARKVEIVQSQAILAEKWDYPFLKLWERTGWSQQSVTSSSVTKTITQWWMPDDLHPGSDDTGAANDFIANIMAPWIRDRR